MALSNIFREPRREIIEQAAGTLVVGGWVVIAWHISGIFGRIPRFYDSGIAEFFERIFLSVLISFGAFLGISILIGGVLLAHLIGESICGFLARAGADPRPRQRY